MSIPIGNSAVFRTNNVTSDQSRVTSADSIVTYQIVDDAGFEWGSGFLENVQGANWKGTAETPPNPGNYIVIFTVTTPLGIGTKQAGLKMTRR